MTRGRRPAGADYVDRVPGSPQAKERVRVILQTMQGKLRVQQACKKLRVSPQRFHQLREEIMRAAVASIEPGAPGRPPRTVTPAEQQIEVLQQQLAAQEFELRFAKARAEIAATLPAVVQPTDAQQPKRKKKNASVVHQANAVGACQTSDVIETSEVFATASAAPAAWEGEAYVNRLCEIGLPTQSPSRDGFGILRRQPARALEHRLRVHVVTLADWTAAHGYTLPEIAGHLHLHARTLRQWQHDVRQDRLRVQPLGRPLLRSARADRQQVLEVLHELGPRTSVATLCDCFPMLPRAELTDLLQRYRRVWRQRYHAHPHVLHWQVAGAVWAIDFAEAPRPIDGLYPYLLAVRDLASHQQLAWLPVRNPTALEVIRVLQSLFVIHGAPLVLKSDNGSHFGADELRLFLELWDVEQLFSPPHMPSYNGAIEAGTGSMKTRTEYHATRAGRPADWSADDPEAAVLEANATARPQGPTGPTPEQSWEKRPPLTAEQRALFRTAVDRLRPAGRAAHDLPMEGPLSTRDHRTVDRYAIRRALEEHAFLSYSRRRIPLPFPKPKTANIT